MSIGTLCNREVVVTDRDTSVAEAAKLMRRDHVGDLVVLDPARPRVPVGLVTDRDIVVEVVAAGLDPEAVTVMDLVTEPLTVATEDTGFWEALATMRRHGVRRLPIVDDGGELVGIVTLDDALELVGEAMGSLVALVSREIDRERTARSDQ